MGGREKRVPEKGEAEQTPSAFAAADSLVETGQAPLPALAYI